MIYISSITVDNMDFIVNNSSIKLYINYNLW